MTVAQLIEALQAMPGHWPACVAITVEGSGGGADVEYHDVIDCSPGSIISIGSLAAIHWELKAA
jgi:hypothetical protein